MPSRFSSMVSSYDNANGIFSPEKNEDEINKTKVNKTIDTNKKIAQNTIKQYTDLYRTLEKLYGLHLKQQLEIDKAYKKQLDILMGGGKVSQADITRQMRMSSMTVKELGEGMEKSVGEMGKSIREGGNEAGKAISSAIIKAAKSFADIFLSRVKEGFFSSADWYQKNFTKIAGRTGSYSYGGTDFTIKAAEKYFKSSDMTKYILENEEYKEAFVKYSEAGIRGSAAYELSLSQSVDAKILPWLEEFSSQFITLSTNVSSNQLKALKGAQVQLQSTEAGNRILQSGVANVLMQEMSPMLATLTMENSTEYQNKILNTAAQIYAQGNGAFTVEQAESMARQMIQVDMNRYSKLESGSVAEKLYSITGDYNKSFGMLAGQIQGISNDLGYGAAANALGISQFAGSEYQARYLASNISPTSLSSQDAIKAYEKARGQVGETETTEQKADIFLKNFGSKVGDIFQDFPYLKEILNVVTGIGVSLGVSKIGGKVIGNVGGKLLGKFGKGGAEAAAEGGKIGGSLLSKLAPAAEKGMSALGKIPAIAGVAAELANTGFGIKQGYDKYKQSGKKSDILKGAAKGTQYFDYKEGDSWLKTFAKTGGNTLLSAGQGLVTGLSVSGGNPLGALWGAVNAGRSSISNNEMWKQYNAYELAQEGINYHAGGLSFVPYDGYSAILHQGERVLTKSENDVYTKAVTTNSNIAAEHNEQLIATVREVAQAIITAIYSSENKASPFETSSPEFNKDIVSLSSNILSNSMRVTKLSESR